VVAYVVIESLMACERHGAGLPLTDEREYYEAAHSLITMPSKKYHLINLSFVRHGSWKEKPCRRDNTVGREAASKLEQW
jgi:hypothetical protein